MYRDYKKKFQNSVIPDVKRVNLYYDILSPYSWLCFEILTRYKSKWRNMDLRLKPLSQEDVLKGAGNQLPGNVPIKMQYILQDLARLGKYHQVPFKIPADLKDVMYVKGSRPAMLFITAVDMENPEYTEELSRQLWLRVWGKDEGITTDDDISQAASKAGISKEMVVKCLNKAKEPDVSARFKVYTDEALSLGAFGTPTIVIHNSGKKEMIFGSDRLDLVANFIGETYEGPLNDLSKIKQ
ncbi:GSTK1 [Mytilus edulis]|uniref:Glutathione S-transferase kappa n=1 Tax=Mytilus edulis TaxID=6550 RepID=A0A8S3RD93_MYTED|nr:GSTK1 [Mytilus edulis]